jgi:hypothetical protein
MAVISPGSGICMTKVSSNTFNKVNNTGSNGTGKHSYPILLTPAKEIPVLCAGIQNVLRLVSLTSPYHDHSCAASTGTTGTLEHRHVSHVPKLGSLRACAKIGEYSVVGYRCLPPLARIAPSSVTARVSTVLGCLSMPGC